MTDGDSKRFWIAFGVLLLARLFFSIIETIGKVIAWHSWGKSQTVQFVTNIFEQGDFPRTRQHDDDFLCYLDRVASDEDLTEDQRCRASIIQFWLQMLDWQGVLAGRRADKAAEIAVARYATHITTEQI
jgi:hypothetical protein